MIDDVTGDMDEIDIGRAVLEAARSLGVQTFTQPRDQICNARLCLFLAAQLFNATCDLQPPIISVRPSKIAKIDAEVMILSKPYDSRESLSLSTNAIFSDLANKTFIRSENDILISPLPAGESVAFAVYINNVLGPANATVGHLLPLDAYGNDWFGRIADGAIVGELLNVLDPETVKAGDLNRASELSAEEKLSNMNIVLQSGVEVGYELGAIDAGAVVAGRCGNVAMRCEIC